MKEQRKGFLFVEGKRDRPQNFVKRTRYKEKTLEETHTKNGKIMLQIYHRATYCSQCKCSTFQLCVKSSTVSFVPYDLKRYPHLKSQISISNIFEEYSIGAKVTRTFPKSDIKGLNLIRDDIFRVKNTLI